MVMGCAADTHRTAGVACPEALRSHGAKWRHFAICHLFSPSGISLPFFSYFRPIKTTADEPRPNISPRPLRPRASSAGRRQLHTPAHLRRACMFVHLHRYRALQTYGLHGRRLVCRRRHCPSPIPPHPQSSAATAHHHRVAEPPTTPTM